jgi:hypothetical protein
MVEAQSRNYLMSQASRESLLKGEGSAYLTFGNQLVFKLKLNFFSKQPILRLVYTMVIIALSYCLLKHRKIFSILKGPSLERFTPQCKHHFNEEGPTVLSLPFGKGSLSQGSNLAADLIDDGTFQLKSQR